MRSTHIRPTTPSDLKVLAEVLIQVHALDGYPVEGVLDPHDWLNLSASLGQWTALVDGVPVGHIAMTQPSEGDDAPNILSNSAGVCIAEIAVLVRLFIAPSARGRSLANELVATVERAAQAMGLRLTLDVMEKDHRAISLYEKRGWVAIGKFRHRYGTVDWAPAIAMAAPAAGRK